MIMKERELTKYQSYMLSGFKQKIFNFASHRHVDAYSGKQDKYSNWNWRANNSCCLSPIQPIIELMQDLMVI